MDEIILNANKISKKYQNGNKEIEIFKDLDFCVKKKDLITIVGNSGVGKSTFLNVIGTLDKSDSGFITINNRKVNFSKPDEISNIRNIELGFIFQFHHLMPDFTVIENVLIPLWIKNKYVNNHYTKARVLLEKLNLTHRSDHFPNELSGGERSRTAVARALINKPSLILADEPTGNLDKKNANKIVDLFVEINRDFNLAFVIATHDSNLAKIGSVKLRLNNNKLEEY